MLVNTNRDRIAERREATRREILDVAWQLARERGLSQLTLRDIAQRVGMRAPSLYSHFESKNAIYDAMFAAAWTECLAVMTAAARNALSRCTSRTLASSDESSAAAREASHTAAVADSTATSMFAQWCFTAWNVAMVRPNCWRTFA